MMTLENTQGFDEKMNLVEFFRLFGFDTLAMYG
jgi:hypothetical protein